MAWTRIDVVRRALQHIGRLDLVGNPRAEHQETALRVLESLSAELRQRQHIWWVPADDVAGIPDMAGQSLSEALGGRLAGTFYSDRNSPRVGTLQAEGARAENHLMFIRPGGFRIGQKRAEQAPVPRSSSYVETVGDGISDLFVVSHMMGSSAVAVAAVTLPGLATAAITTRVLTPDSVEVRFTTVPAAAGARVTVTLNA
jgi:hypothetical protein